MDTEKEELSDEIENLNVKLEEMRIENVSQIQELEERIEEQKYKLE